MANRIWWMRLARVTLLCVLAGAVGLAAGHPAIAMLVVLAAQVASDSLQLGKVHRWLRTGLAADPPNASGAWGEVVGSIARVQRRRQYYKRRLLQLLRQVRRSTSALPDGVVMLNPQAEILWFNRMAGRLLGLRARSDLGLRIDNLLRQPEFIRYLGRAEFGVPVVLRMPAAAPQYLQVQLVPYGDGQLLMLARDVTRQEQLEAMRRDFVANASHELRSPLTVIAGYLETIGNDAGLDAALRGPVAEMRRQAARMTGLIEDLLELSRLEADGGAAASDPVDVRLMLGQLQRDAQARAGGPVAVEARLESARSLLGDEAQVHSAFSNLLDNAAKYTPAGGRIALRWWDDADGGHFSVSDTGPGIAAEHLPRLTERFYRVDVGRSRATGGSGLGLAIVKHVMQRHGGTLAIESREGEGSTFTCHFPAARLGPPVAA